MDSILAKHKEEKKELLKKVQALKHAVPKGDKKKKKEVAELVAKLEIELEDKQSNELKLCEADEHKPYVDNESDLSNEINGLCIEENQISRSRISKAEKRRQKKELKAKELEETYRQAELDYEHSTRKIEYDKIRAKLQKRNLEIFEIPSDGNCMFKAIEHQLQIIGISKSVQELRHKVASSLRNNKILYQAFLSDENTGDPLSDLAYDQYCEKMEKEPAWGGHLELQILSESLQSKICVVQADGPDIILGEDYGDKCLCISFHRHALGLGEHYNSTTELQMSEPENIN